MDKLFLIMSTYTDRFDADWGLFVLGKMIDLGKTDNAQMQQICDLHLSVRFRSLFGGKASVSWATSKLIASKANKMATAARAGFTAHSLVLTPRSHAGSVVPKWGLVVDFFGRIFETNEISEALLDSVVLKFILCDLLRAQKLACYEHKNWPQLLPSKPFIYDLRRKIPARIHFVHSEFFVLNSKLNRKCVTVFKNTPVGTFDPLENNLQDFKDSKNETINTPQVLSRKLEKFEVTTFLSSDGTPLLAFDPLPADVLNHVEEANDDLNSFGFIQVEIGV
jgi:hypothetical protein